MIEPILKSAPLPGGIKGNGSQGKCRRIGQVSTDAVAIFVHEKVLEEILDFSHEDLQREIGGFLIGNLYCNGSKSSDLTYVEVENFLPAVHAVSQSASLTFTHETWSKANNAVHSRYSDKRIVGWHHTHPGLGVFLSAYDRFIHRNFFGQDWQIAMVVDPCQQEFGFYQWQGDEVVDCGFIYIPDSTNLN